MADLGYLNMFAHDIQKPPRMSSEHFRHLAGRIR